MVERQDIDALLISALYGELTPAEETRLAAHLESHPADRTALDDLTRAREALHASRILAFQYEPPQSISALLLQEASRRAPKKAPEGEGWFARFVRSFIQHPAMAAAAMIVVVVGASSLVSRTSPNQFADTPPVETTTSGQVAMEEAPAVASPTVAPDLDNADQYKVMLADEGKPDADRAQAQASPEMDPSVRFYDSKLDSKAEGVASNKGTKNDRSGGIELRRPEPVPKDFDEVNRKPAEEQLAKQQLAQQMETERANRQRQVTEREASTAAVEPSADDMVGYADGRGGSVPGGGAPVTPKPTITRAAPPPPPPTKTPRQEIATDATTTTGSATRDAQKSKEKDKADKVANDPNLAWAKDQHAALVTAVRANNCGRAANIALAIANRTPAYYAQNVETDRSVKQCIAYINNEREKDAELRATRAKKSTLKNAEPAAPKRAADQPAATESK